MAEQVDLLVVAGVHLDDAAGGSLLVVPGLATQGELLKVRGGGEDQLHGLKVNWSVEGEVVLRAKHVVETADVQPGSPVSAAEAKASTLAYHGPAGEGRSQ